MALATAVLSLFTTFTAFGIQAQAPPPTPAQPPSPVVEELWAAARAGDVARVTAALDKGADANAKTRYGATALTFAADKGHLDVVKLLVSRGADVSAQDSFYQMRAIDMAMQNDHVPVVLFLLERGSKGAGTLLVQAARSGNLAVATAALAGEGVTPAHVRGALAAAKQGKRAEIVALLEKKLAELPADTTPAVKVDRAILQSYAGTYRNEAAGQSVTVAVRRPAGGDAAGTGAPQMTLAATSPTTFRLTEAEGLTLTFEAAAA
jgi:hypothetical protein